MTQEREQAVRWPPSMHTDSPMAHQIGDEDDFANFLDLENDFSNFEDLDQTHSHSGLDTPMGRLTFGQHPLHDHQFNNHAAMTLAMTSQPVVHTSNPYSQDMTLQHFDQCQQYHHMAAQHNFQVPPTPISSEMTAAGKYVQHIEGGRLGFEQQQASFTPLVSPAQTPLDGTFAMPDFSGVEDFFSPLTSPAIEAQATFHSTGTATSPLDLSGEQTSVPKGLPTGSRKPHRRNSIVGRGSNRSVRQSPAMKPQHRKRQGSTTSIPADKLEALIYESVRHGGLRPNAVPGSDESVSPEPLSEVLMRPPPVPSSVRKSPHTLVPSQKATSQAPVTPSMIMRMASDPALAAEARRSAAAGNGANDEMEDIQLPTPAAADMRPPLPAIETDLPGSDQSTPTLSAKSAKMSASSTPRTATVKPANGSHESIGKVPKLDPRGRGNKKRPSTSSAAMSPALRPRISPSISPLVPSTGGPILTPETSAIYLASKSNYQNILDGTHLPGVSYPDTLAENLSSKRTSHKIAEQGRRNRINLALKEIESLLPPNLAVGGKKEKSSPDANEEGEKSTSTGSSTSKASTVEMAIVYIKTLQAELKATTDRLQATEKELAAQSGKTQSPEQVI